MGYVLSWAAVNGSLPEQVRSNLGLIATGKREEFPESEITGALLPSGWYMVATNLEVIDLVSDGVLKRLSSLGQVVTCLVNEIAMHSLASCWQGGRSVWSVYHDSERGIEHLNAEGDLPPSFAEIRDRLRSEQAAYGAKEPRCDFIFDVPVELAHVIAGYRHDGDVPGLAPDAFEVLSVAPHQP